MPESSWESKTCETCMFMKTHELFPGGKIWYQCLRFPPTCVQRYDIVPALQHEYPFVGIPCEGRVYFARACAEWRPTTA